MSTPQRHLRTAAEFIVSTILIATLAIAGCGGKSNSSNAASNPADNTAITSATVTPYKGPFAQGATIALKDANGNPVTLLSGGTINASGVANVTYNANVAYPLLVEVSGSYYNEITGQSETTAVPLRSLIATSAVASSVPVTIVTETAVADLQNKIGGGNFSATAPINAASAVAALTAAGNAFGVPASAVPSFDPITRKSRDHHTIRLAAFAYLANNQAAGSTLLDRVRSLAKSMATLNAASAPSDVISQAALTAAMTAMTSGASSVMDAGVTAPVVPTISTTTLNGTPTAATNSIVGSWYNVKLDGISPSFGSPTTTVWTFFAEGHYFNSQSIVSGAVGETPGLEYGTYTWNSTTGALVIACPTVDTNGTAGFSPSCANGATSLNRTATISGNKLTVANSAVATLLTFERVTDATNPIVGSWYLSGGPNFVAAQGPGGTTITYFANGDYMHSQAIMDGTPAQQAAWQVWPGLEKGTYTWNATTGAFANSCPTVDTNGSAGFSNIAPGGYANGLPVGTACSYTTNPISGVTVSGNTMTLGKNIFTRVAP